MQTEILVTGTKSGIGRYMHEQLGGTGLNRQSDDLNELKRRSFEAIIHCACNFMPTRLITNENLNQYFYDNVLLTRKLLEVPHKFFVFFSTIDLYPDNGQPHPETEIIYADSVRSIYAATKLLSESLITEKAENFLILRATSLSGSYMRKNNLVKLVEDSYPVLSLRQDSLFNLIRYPDVLEFINAALSRREKGIYNLASAENISLARIAEIVGKNVIFGDYRYNAGNILNWKAAQISPAFKKTSEKVLKEFLAERGIS